MIYMQILRSFYFRSESRFVRFWICAIFWVVLTGCVNSTSGVSSTNRPESDKALVHAKLAQGYLSQKQYAVAKEELDEALRIDYSHSESNYIMALLMLELQQYEVSEEHFIRSVNTDSNNSAAAHDFGTYLCRTGRERDAVRYFDIAAGNPLFELAHLSYMRAGECLARINDPSAEAYLQRALGINSRLGPALYQLALIKYNSAEHLSARAYIQRYLAINNPQPASLLLAYKIESSLNAIDFADEYRKQLLEQFPGSQQAREARLQSGGR